MLSDPFTDAHVTCLRNSTVIQKNIPVQLDEMDPSKAKQWNAQNPTDAWEVIASGNFDIKRGDVLMNEADNTVKYIALTDSRHYAATHHDELYVERLK